MELYFDPKYDRILITCSVPIWYRGNEEKTSHLATMLCAIAVTSRVAPTWDNEKVCYMVIDDTQYGGQKIVTVFLRGERPEVVPDPEGEVNLDNLLGEDDGRDHTTPPSS